MSIINFTIHYDLLATAPDGIDVGSDSDLIPLIGNVTFTPQLKDRRPAQAVALTPRPAGILLQDITGYIDSNGQLRSTVSGALGVRLPTNDPVLELDRLTYRVSFDVRTPLGEKVTVEGGVIAAPSEDIPVNLVNLLQPTGTIITSTLREAAYVGDLADAGAFGRSVVRTHVDTDFWDLLGTVPSENLPSYVDDVLAYANQAAFPATGETGKIYVAEDTGDTFRWTGSAYLRISDRITVSGITDAGTAGKALVRSETQADALRALGGIPRQEPKSLLQVGPYAWYELAKMPTNAQWLGMDIYRMGGTPTAESMLFYANNNWEVLWGAGAPGEFSSYANQAAFNASYLASIDATMSVYGPRGSYWTSDALANGHQANLHRYSPIAQVEIMNEPNIWFPWPGGNSYAPQYASALIAAYDHIKANWPEVQVVACSAMGAQAAAPDWVNAVMDALIAAGRLDAFDIVSTHCYTDGSQSPEEPMYESWIAEPHRPITVMGSVANYAALPTGLSSGDAGKAWRSNADTQLYVWTGSAWPAQGSGQLSWNLDTEMQQVKQGLLARGVTRPLWITEVGWNISHADGGYFADSSNVDNLGNHPRVSLSLQAAYEVRMAMVAARAGIDRVYYMNVADTDGANMGWFNTSASALSSGDSGAAVAAPRPVAVAMRLLNKLISGATQFEVVLDGSAAPLTAPYAYRFTTPRGRVTVAWCQGGSTTAIPIDPDYAMTVTDQVGTVITTLPVGTTSYTATLSATPIFISPGVTSPRHKLVSVTGSVTLPSDAATDYIVSVGSGGVPVLPSAKNNQSMYQITNVDSTSKTLTTAGTDPAVVIHLEGEGTNGSTTIIDDAGNVWTCANGAAISTTQKKFGSSSLKFTASTHDYMITSSPSASFNPGRAPFTFSCWVYPTSIPSGDWWCIATGRAVGSEAGAPFMVLAYDRKAAWLVGGTNLVGWSVALETSSADVYTVNTWHHVAVVGQGYGNPITMYVNGVSVLTNTQPDFGTGAIPIAIGGDPGNVPASPCLTGYVDDVCYTMGTALWTSGFTPPATASQNSQLIDGASSLAIAPGATVSMFSTGSGWTNASTVPAVIANNDGTATL